jgi:Tfp pilus assembly protein PilV
MSALRNKARGMALVEALVAMAVMAFGMLAIVGVQGTLRLNSDTAKQRSEAVRIAQAALEQHRRYTALSVPPGGAVAGETYYDNVISAGPNNVAGTAGQNTTFVRTDTVPNPTADPRFRTLTVDVAWEDRAGAPQVVRLSSMIAGVPPELAGSLGLPMQRSLTSQPGGRNTAIPVSATDLGNGTSAFKPPQSILGSVAWVFNNATGLFTVCTTTAASTAALTQANISACGTEVGQLLSGQVRFATGAAQPDAATAELPPIGLARNLDIELTLTSLNHPSPGSTCFDDAPLTLADASTVAAVNYFCAILANPSKTWSGIANLVPRAFTDVGEVVWTIAASGAGEYKVCRYTPAANDAAVIPNSAHPRNYSNVTKSLVRQNFLVIAAANNCPTDVAADPATGDFVNSNTLVHQPEPP